MLRQDAAATEAATVEKALALGMSLEEYRRKRRFAKTPEPAIPVGDPLSEEASIRRRFVVQKHAASRLHYDLRLELDGVLKSWAVPKGPSLNPDDKRLAIQVEDHPLEYLHFEGVIPQGEYGGGTVLVWDTGTWERVGEGNYESGDLKFRLHGHKLQGQWMLVHTGKRKGREHEQRQWLLFKERDAAARGRETDILGELPHSVLSGRTLEDVAASPEAVWTSADTQRASAAMHDRESQRRSVDAATTIDRQAPARRRTKSHRSAKKTTMPSLISPAIPTARKTPPAGDAWQHEIKFDGYRMLAFVGQQGVRFISRNGNDWTDRLTRMAARLQGLTQRQCILDGEIVFLAADGSTNFQTLQNTIGRGDDRALSYCVFDLLYLDGYDLTKLALEDRRALLAELLSTAVDRAVIFSEHLDADGALVFEKAAQLGAEGIVSKRKGSVYPRGRTTDWLKTKCVRSDAFVVGGYTSSTANPRALGALVVGRYENGALHYEGRVGSGFSAAAQETLLAALQEIQSDDSPFCDLSTREMKNLRTVEPILVVEVEYGGWTADRRLRFPSYRGQCDDRTAETIERSRTAASDVQQTLSTDITAALQKSRLTHPDRMMYPAIGVTKLGLATYYAEIADWIFPYVVDRPLAVIRYPKGLGGPSFFQKSLPSGMPANVRALESAGSRNKALVIRDVAGLLALVQFSALEIHCWGARADRPDKPDRVVFDLDPDSSVPFPRVAEAAHEIRDLLAGIDLECFVMTTGGKGLHVTLPVRRTWSWDRVKSFSKAVAAAIATRSPGRFTISPSKSARRGKIYIDYLRNGEGATAIVPYSTRAHPTASVAAPISWEEVGVLPSAAAFSITNLRRRLETLVDDPWKSFSSVKQSLTVKRLAKIEGLVRR
jgi:bifunctional non-homologous end joining protein LigD